MDEIIDKMRKRVRMWRHVDTELVLFSASILITVGLGLIIKKKTTPPFDVKTILYNDLIVSGKGGGLKLDDGNTTWTGNATAAAPAYWPPVDTVGHTMLH